MDPVATETLQAQPGADAAALQAQPVAYQQPDGVAVPASGKCGLSASQPFCTLAYRTCPCCGKLVEYLQQV